MKRKPRNSGGIGRLAIRSRRETSARTLGTTTSRRKCDKAAPVLSGELMFGSGGGDGAAGGEEGGDGGDGDGGLSKGILSEFAGASSVSPTHSRGH
eukprot:4826463-Prymnesium_polylepis.1